MRSCTTLFFTFLVTSLAATAAAQSEAQPGWDFGVIPYSVAADVTAAARADLAWAFASWSGAAPVRFVERTTQAGYLDVAGTPDTGVSTSGCSGTLGQPQRGVRLTLLVAACADRDAMVRAVGQALGLTGDDWRTVAGLYTTQLQPSTSVAPSETPQRQFNREEIALALERLHALFASRYGMHRSDGLVVDGQLDFTSITHWILDVYAGARSQGWNTEDAFAIVLAGVTQNMEWQQANPRRVPLVPMAFAPAFSFDDGEFIGVMERLDSVYRTRLGRATGLILDDGPDFQALAAWVFDVYLTERLRGISATAAWIVTENQIRVSEESRARRTQ
jgi:hypothetical protein